MAKSSSPKSPSRPTAKRLFALSGNRCAYPACETRLVDRDTGSVVGEVCHIKGERPSAPRYDSCQDDRARHGFDNLILLCNVHHKVIDDNPGEYPVERLLGMKKEHEVRVDGKDFIDDATAKTFASAAMKYFVTHGSVIQATNVTGSQVAHTITNIYSTPPDDEPVRLEGHISFSATVQPFGCPYLELKVVCRSNRPAKIRKAMLCLVGKGIMAAFQEGFGSNMNYAPVPGMEEEEVSITLFPDRQRTSPDGYILQRDDVVRFAYPVFAGPVGLFLDQQPSALSMRVEFFDESEQVIVAGEELKRALADLVEITRKTPCAPRLPSVEINVKVKTTSLPDMSLAGKVNPKPVVFPPKPDSTSSE